jgi:hypothetical protein
LGHREEGDQSWIEAHFWDEGFYNGRSGFVLRALANRRAVFRASARCGLVTVLKSGGARLTRRGGAGDDSWLAGRGETHYLTANGDAAPTDAERAASFVDFSNEGNSIC